jgi:tetratricopeptide (TPR) repeat protein
MQHGKGAAVAAPAGRSGSIRRMPDTIRRRLGWALFLITSAAVAACALPYTPVVQEWRLAHASVPALIRAVHGDIGRADDPRPLYYLGLRLNQMGRFQEADPVLRRGVGLDPNDPRLRDEWARALLGSGLTTAAFGELREFAGTHPNMPQAHLILAKFYVTQRSMRRASEELNQTVQKDPGCGEAWSYLAAAEESLGDAARALSAARRAVALRPKDAADHLLLATLLATSNQPADARAEYLRSVALGPRLAKIHREYAMWLLQSGAGEADARNAEAEARLAVAIDPKDAAAQSALGNALIRRGQWAEATDALQRAADLAQDDPVAPSLLARACEKLGRSQEADKWRRVFRERERDAAERQTLFEALRVNPNSPALHTRMARLVARQGDVDGCVHSHATALRCAVDAPPALIAAANDLTDGGHAADALPMARRAVNISPANPGAHEALGNALLATGLIHLAGLEYNKTVTWWPRRAPVLRKKLQAYYAERAKNPPPSELAYREARRIEHESFGPRRMTPEVEASAQRAVALEPTNPNYVWYLFSVQLARRENDAALQTGAQLLALTPRDARAHALVALLLVDKAAKPEEFAAVEAHLRAAEGEPAASATRHYVLGLLALRRQQAANAVRELREAVKLDPRTDVTYYKLAQAEQMAGDTVAADREMKEYRSREETKKAEADALSDVRQHSNSPGPYEKAAALFESHGLLNQADAIRAEARRRFAGRAEQSASR